MQHVDTHRETYSQDHPAPPSVWKDLGALLIKIAAIAAITLLLFTFVYGLHYVTEPSMTPAIEDGDLLLYYRWDKDYHSNDLVVFKKDGAKQVRRVVASSGDEVDITDAGLVINGSVQQERSIYAKTQRYETDIKFPLVVGQDEVFVLGDAREGVSDSRVYGPIPQSKTQGTVIALLRRRSL